MKPSSSTLTCRGAAVVILGGAGQMGQVFARVFGDNGANVTIVDRVPTDDARSGGTEVEERSSKPKRAALEALPQADIVLLALPIEQTVELIKEFAPLVPKHALLMDLTSLKMKEVSAMLKYSDPSVEVLGAHPLFGPYADISGQVIALTPARGERWLPAVEELLTSGGLIPIRMEADEHDKLMSVVQGLLHVMLYSLVGTVSSFNISSDQLKRLSTPIYKIVWALGERILSHDSRLYEHIALDNPYNLEILEEFQRHFETFQSFMRAGDREGFTQQFNALKTFTQQESETLDSTQNLIDFFSREFAKNCLQPSKENSSPPSSPLSRDD